jgi:XTP/dITP diphosphohydrolase
MKKLLIATHNPGKFKEIVALFEGLNLFLKDGAKLKSKKSSVEFVSLSDLGVTEDYEEVGESFEENALGKARFYSKLTGLAAVADDSGLFVNALKGELGVKTRRWGAGKSASDAQWLVFFMDRLKEEEDRSASFVCAAALAMPEESVEEDSSRVGKKDRVIFPAFEKVFFGEIEGVITKTIEGPLYPGIPVSSVFIPVGADRVFTLMTKGEKNRFSHRGAAFAQVLEELKSKLN